MLGFLDGLGVVGWLGIFIWFGLLACILLRPKWFTSYEERFPKIDLFDEYLYSEAHYIGFMVVRFILIIVVMIVASKVMFLF